MSVSRKQDWWGYVTQVDPLMVARFAGDSPTASVRVSGCLASGLVVGDRVFVQVNGTAATILGRNGGGSAPVPGEGGAFKNFTPTLVDSSGATLTWGNSNRQGRYTRIGDLVTFFALIEFGSTFNAGSASNFLMLPLPVDADASARPVVMVHVAASSIFGGEGSGDGKIENAGDVTRMYTFDFNLPGPRALRSNMGWGAGNRLIVSGSYPAAV